MGADRAGETLLAAGTAGRDGRFAGDRAALDAQDRPQYHRPIGNFPTGDRRYALRRIRTAAGGDHFWSTRPAPRYPRSHARFPRRRVFAGDAIRAVAGRTDGAAVGADKIGDVGLSTHDQPSGYVSVGDAVVLSRARTLAGRSHCRDPECGTDACQARLAHGPLSGIREGFRNVLGKPALPDRGCDHRRLHRSGSCTKVSFIRSRSFRRCLRRASEPFWRSSLLDTIFR
jgi:hypothetical protein